MTAIVAIANALPDGSAKHFVPLVAPILTVVIGRGLAWGRQVVHRWLMERQLGRSIARPRASLSAAAANATDPQRRAYLFCELRKAEDIEIDRRIATVRALADQLGRREDGASRRRASDRRPRVGASQVHEVPRLCPCRGGN
jgi:hypothetical protein